MVVSIEVFTQKHLDIARNFGKENSLCSRRKYGAIIIDQFGNIVAIGANERIGHYCSKNFCIRDLCKIENGDHSRVELGGEIHAEQAALIVHHPREAGTYHFLLTGMGADGHHLDGISNYPCHVCALMIKFAGFTNIWMPFGDEIRPVSIDEIIESYERQFD